MRRLLRRVSTDQEPALSTRPFAPRPLPAWPLTLVIIDSAGVSRRELPRTGVLQIGREQGSDIHLDDDGVSRNHARLELLDRVRIVDLGSRNGTRVGGRRLRPNEPQEVRQDEAIEVGGAVLLVHARGVEPASLRRAGRTASSCAAMLRVRTLCDHAAEADFGVLLCGETGVGKARLAQTIHDASRRRGGVFDTVDCRALRPDALAARIFGADDMPGALEIARGGSVLLRHVGGLPDDLQARLIAVLDAGEVTRVGRNRPRPIDARVMATSRDTVPALLQSGLLRRDLALRVARMTIAVPPLRDRGDEIAAALSEAVRRHALAFGRSPPRPSTATVRAAESYDWPGNLRELDARIGQAVVLCEADALRPEHLALESTGAATAHDDPADGLERRAIIEALSRCAGNQSQAARLLGISRRTLVSRLERHQIPRPRDRPR